LEFIDPWTWFVQLNRLGEYESIFSSQIQMLVRLYCITNGIIFDKLSSSEKNDFLLKVLKEEYLKYAHIPIKLIGLQ
jgi:hypothetical protein